MPETVGHQVIKIDKFHCKFIWGKKIIVSSVEISSLPYNLHFWGLSSETNYNKGQIWPWDNTLKRKNGKENTSSDPGEPTP